MSPERIADVDAFVQRHFTWPGTLRLHRVALGRDILRAPANLLLSPVLVLVRVLGWLCGRFGLHAMSAWLRGRRILLRTSVAARLEAAILSELCGVPLAGADRLRSPAALRHALRAAPRFCEAQHRRGDAAGAGPVADRIMSAISEYTGTRSAMAEVAAALIALVVGAIALRSLTPGMISMAPGIAGAVSLSAAIADFPLGTVLGGIWYRIFPVGPSLALVAATLFGLMLLGSVITAFAGALADPVQVRIGIHRHRLIRLVAILDAELEGRPSLPFVAHAHFLARIFDIWDACLSLLRVFRN
jgi:hypothetical protein